MPASESPQLPPNIPTAESLRYEVNPAIALTLIGELHGRVSRYQLTLRRLVKRIQAVYAEGPVVAGWLASAADIAQTTGGEDAHQALFRHGDAQQLMDYLRQLETGPEASVSAESAATQYYFCQLDTGGKIYTELCPPPQVPVLSMAIARYRRLSLLVQQKQAVEAKLQTLVERLEPLVELLSEE